MEKVTAAVIEKNGKILIAKRKRSQKLGGKWEFPGGKLEPGETPEECLKRELREELGIDAIIGPYICFNTFTYRHITIKLLAYRISRFSGTIKLNDHEKIKWILPKDLNKYDLAEADIPIAEAIANLI